MYLSAYYLNGSLFSTVPRHLAEDFRWMADHGTRAVCVSMYEKDLDGRTNWDLICGEAEKAGLAVYSVPSRWGGLIAGWPGAPSQFACTHPETWIRYEDGAPNFRGTWGPMCSVFHPATMEYLQRCLDRVLDLPVAGLIWDEPKPLVHPDFSDAAKAALDDPSDAAAQLAGVADFFDRAGAYAKARRPDLDVVMFLYEWFEDAVLARCARIASLDTFGCDGRPWSKEENEALKGPMRQPKTLLPGLDRFNAAARAAGKKSFVLVETQAIPEASYEVVDRRLPEVLAKGSDHVSYYYYPRGLDDPDRLMNIVGKHLKAVAG